VIVLTTGGTIASTPSAAGVVASTGGDGLAGVGIAPEMRSLTSVNGFAIETAQMLSIARAVRDGAKEGVGVVGTHGTDTLEETAYLSDLL
jgi:L-asparaginase